MKLKKSIVYVTALLVLATSPAVFAGVGQDGGTGTCPNSNLEDGVHVTVNGMVASIGVRGAGMTVDTGDEMVTVYGIGPVRFWNDAGVSRPDVGEQVSVSGYEMTLSDGTTRIIATEITVGDKTVVLRDSESGMPVWRGSAKHSGQGSMKRCQRWNGSRRQ